MSIVIGGGELMDSCFLKGISVKWNTNTLVHDLNSGHWFYFVLARIPLNFIWSWASRYGAMRRTFVLPLSVQYLNSVRRFVEYAVCISWRRIRFSAKRSYPEYYSQLHMLVRLLFWRSGDYGASLHCYYSQVHSEPK